MEDGSEYRISKTAGVTGRTRWVLILRTGTDGDDARAIRGLRWLCKTAGRSYGLKVIEIREDGKE